MKSNSARSTVRQIDLQILNLTNDWVGSLADLHIALFPNSLPSLLGRDYIAAVFRDTLVDGNRRDWLCRIGLTPSGQLVRYWIGSHIDAINHRSNLFNKASLLQDFANSSGPLNPRF